MKKLVILILVLVFLFSMMACWHKDVSGDLPFELRSFDYEDKNAREEALYKNEIVQAWREDPREIVFFLVQMHVLPESPEAIDEALKKLAKDEIFCEWAIEEALTQLAEMHIDCNWEELRKIAPRSDDFATYEDYKAYMEQNHPTLPLATNAETGEPISSEPAGPWAGPTD